MPEQTDVLVTGATGFVGRHLMPVLREQRPGESIVGLSSRDYNLMDPAQVERMFERYRPRRVVHLAALSAGIGANRRRPAEFYYVNTLLVAHVFDAAARHGVEKLIYTMGGCSYPADATSPIGEDQMWRGYPDRNSAGYSTAKMMGIVASESYRAQHGLNSVVLVPGNLYGEYDNFRTDESHVVPAFIRRYHEAMRRGDDEVVMWGTGEPVRDFVYAGDVARAIAWFIDNYDSSEPVNISTGTRTSIRELAEAVRDATGFQGRIRWDTDKPNGQMVKIFDVSRLKSLGLACRTPLAEGIARTGRWFAEHYAAESDGIRL